MILSESIRGRVFVGFNSVGDVSILLTSLG